ncbi:unnamed protein product [Didymodactylos carnosus]|uniref:Endonuclease n=1 Tax=Didymodactylos carnosus TaxID=1234261 RepID=A0A813Y048_9BILA|nr:unnamed protein product [Didymodactylos carnosus]CAF0961210.1 unnamed protein product [Didymodactylos carnosus]CAF3662697.1 unnamed protein product [Didymodactylos carnosus]CAF3734048.1 unnamed protein product [Didymodactylos carnosus]
MAHAQGIGSLAVGCIGLVFGVVATGSYYKYKEFLQQKSAVLLRYSPELPTESRIDLDVNFGLVYDRRNRIPLWTIEHLTRETIKPGIDVDRGKSNFCEDNNIHPFFRSSNADYAGMSSSGYDRGHLVPAANHRHSQHSMNNTFFLSNIAPQVGEGFNRDKWSHLERYVRALVKYYANLWVVSGPIFLPRREQDGKLYMKYEMIGANQVAVPTHFFKIIIGRTKDSHIDVLSYMLPNAPIDNDVPLETFLVPVDVLERNAGFLITNKFSKQDLRYINQPLPIDFKLFPPGQRRNSLPSPLPPQATLSEPSSSDV